MAKKKTIKVKSHRRSSPDNSKANNGKVKNVVVQGYMRAPPRKNKK